jgi:transcription elongation factor GreB
MSKAFTSGDVVPESVRRAPPRPTGELRPITPEGRAALEAQLRDLDDARSALRQPGAPLDASARLAELEAQAALVQGLLASTQVVVTAPAQQDRAYFGAQVVLEDASGERLEYRLVGPDEADARAGKLSVASPLGRAILGREVGEEVQVDRPRGRATFELIGLRYG